MGNSVLKRADYVLRYTGDVIETEDEPTAEPPPAEVEPIGPPSNAVEAQPGTPAKEPRKFYVDDAEDGFDQRLRWNDMLEVPPLSETGAVLEIAALFGGPAEMKTAVE